MRDLLPHVQESFVYAIPTLVMLASFLVFLRWIYRRGAAEEFRRASLLPFVEEDLEEKDSLSR